MKPHLKARKSKFCDFANKTSTWRRLSLQTSSLWASSWTLRERSALKWTDNSKRPSTTTTRIKRYGKVVSPSSSIRETSLRKTTRRPPRSSSQRWTSFKKCKVIASLRLTPVITTWCSRCSSNFPSAWRRHRTHSRTWVMSWTRRLSSLKGKRWHWSSVWNWRAVTRSQSKAT
jgi:hypothetical protein